MKICVIIPVYNESKAIASLVKPLRARGLDVLVIDDGSTDRSGPIAKLAGANVIPQEKKHGKGYSLQKGFQYALKLNYEGVITMDGDGQHSVEDIDLFLDEIKKFPVSIVTGNRMHDVKRMPPVRRMTNIFMSKVISWACRTKVPDTQCGFRYIHCDILRNISVVSQGYEIETEILMKAAKRKYLIHSVNIKTIYADEESHIHPVKDAYRFTVFFLREIFSRR